MLSPTTICHNADTHQHPEPLISIFFHGTSAGIHMPMPMPIKSRKEMVTRHLGSREPLCI
jgi:hypothetical protein